MLKCEQGNSTSTRWQTNIQKAHNAGMHAVCPLLFVLSSMPFSQYSWSRLHFSFLYWSFMAVCIQNGLTQVGTFRGTKRSCDESYKMVDKELWLLWKELQSARRKAVHLPKRRLSSQQNVTYKTWLDSDYFLFLFASKGMLQGRHGNWIGYSRLSGPPNAV